MIPVVSVAAPVPDVLPDHFKGLLNYLHLDEAGSYLTTDGIILLIERSVFSATTRKKDKSKLKKVLEENETVSSNLSTIQEKL